jgi:hypothetical protein
MTGLLAFDANQHVGSIAPLAISKGVRIFLPYYKLFSTTDRDEIFAAGKAAGVEVGIIPIFEISAERALQGAATGTEDGKAIAAYMKQCGQPPGTSYILTFDFDEQTAQDPACHAYTAAVVAEVPNNPMIDYGNGALSEELKTDGLAKFAWDAGGMAMRGTRADIAAGAEDMEQDVGDVRGLHLGISIDSDFAPHATSPADLDAWMDGMVLAVEAPAGPPALPDPVAAPLPTLTELQEGLVNAGAQIAIDGIWGPDTATAIASYYDR